MEKRIKLVKHGEFIRVDVSEFSNMETIIQEIKRHVDGIGWVGSQYDDATFVVADAVYETKADAILAILSFDENFETEFNAIESSARNDYGIGCSRIEDDTQDEGTDRTRHSNKTVYEVVEILAIQPYIHYFSPNMSEELRNAFTKLSEEIVKAKNIDKSVFVPQAS